MVAASPVGEDVTLKVIRDGEERSLPVQIGRLGTEEGAPRKMAQPTKGKWGMGLQDISPQIARHFGLESDKGVVVTRVQPGSPAQRAGIKAGDIILEVDREAVDSVQEAKELISETDNDSLLLLVKRGKGSVFVPLTAA
jgi:serine protease Do